MSSLSDTSSETSDDSQGSYYSSSINFSTSSLTEDDFSWSSDEENFYIENKDKKHIQMLRSRLYDDKVTDILYKKEDRKFAKKESRFSQMPLFSDEINLWNARFRSCIEYLRTCEGFVDGIVCFYVYFRV